MATGQCSIFRGVSPLGDPRGEGHAPAPGLERRKMEEYKFKAFYYDAHERLLGTDVINQVNHKPDYEMAYEFAALIAETHHPTCTRVEVCRLAEKKDSCVSLSCW